MHDTEIRECQMFKNGDLGMVAVFHVFNYCTYMCVYNYISDKLKLYFLLRGLLERIKLIRG